MLKWSLVCLFLLPALAYSAPPSDQQVRQLLLASQARAGLDTYMEGFEQNSLAALQRSMPEVMADARSRQEMQAMVAETAQQLREQLDWEVLEPRYIRMYQQVMTAAEVEAMTRFYRSPEGASAMAKMPQLMTLSQEMVYEVVGELMRKQRPLPQRGTAPVMDARPVDVP
jgi:uncharacterized protein